MANPVSFPADIIVSGNIRVGGSISPAIAKANILALAELQLVESVARAFFVTSANSLLYVW